MEKKNLSDKLLDVSFGGTFFYNKKLEHLNGILFSDVLSDFNKIKNPYAQAAFISFLKNSPKEQMKLAGKKLDLMLLATARDIYERFILYPMREVSRSFNTGDFDAVMSNLTDCLIETGNQDIFYLCRLSYNAEVGNECIPDIRFSAEQIESIKKLYAKNS